MTVNKICALEIRRICLETAERHLEATIKAAEFPPGTPGRATSDDVKTAQRYVAESKEALIRTKEANI